MRRVHRPGAEVEKERFVGGDLLAVRDHSARAFDEIGSQVVTLLGRCGRLDLVIVVNEVRVVLARVTPEKAVVALETAPERPAIVRTRGAGLLGGREVPFPD